MRAQGAPPLQSEKCYLGTFFGKEFDSKVNYIILFFRVPSTIRSCLGSDEHRKSSFNMRAQGAPPLQIEKMLTPLMQITDTFIAMPLKALSPKHSHAEARAVAPAGGRREGGGRDGGREPQTCSERAAWREGDVIHQFDCSCVRHGSAGS